MSEMLNQPGDFAGFLSDLAKTTNKDQTVPAFATGIRLHTADGVLHGWSTDRFRAAHAVTSVTGALTEPVFLARRDAEAAAKALRKAATVDVSCAHDKLTLSGGGVTLTYALMDVDLPDDFYTRKLNAELPDEHGPVRFQNVYLADFAAIAKRRDEYVDLVPGTGRRPTAIRIGDHYRGWVMPIITTGREDEIVWLEH